TYRLLVFKEHVCEQIVLLSSAALSAAEKRDYEHCFAARQQLFFTTSLRLRGSSSFVGRVLYAAARLRLRFPSRTAFPLARKRRDSMQPTSNTQAVCENIFKSFRALPRTEASGQRRAGPTALRAAPLASTAAATAQCHHRFLNTGLRFSTNAAIPSF
ncbi:hypothetical protein, partial [Burkholderia multivorans]|uniref:hypothetical protein n=1 Tax=Burkholderia multivorans TaxID=87883 RepID=UPI001C23D1D8